MGVIGAILGDIIGSQYEFSTMRPYDLDWRNVPLFTDHCRITDDSILTLATKGAILEGEEFNIDPYYEKWYWIFGTKFPYGGYGGMFRRWLNSPSRKPYGSFGNGSAMRVSYIGEHYEDGSEVIKQAKLSAKVTHNSHQGIKGAIVTAACNSMVKFKNATKQDIYSYCLPYYGNKEVYKYPISMPLKEMRKIYQWDVTCQGSVPAAIRCVLEADSYEEFIRNVMSLPCDMDTLGAIGGGIAEELFGLKDFQVEDILKRYIKDPYLLDLTLK